MQPRIQEGEACEDCNRQSQETWFCEQCDAIYCDACWVKPLPHRKGRKGTGSILHEKANWLIARRLKSILTPTDDPVEQQKLHDRDINTAWFGVIRNITADPLPGLRDYGRFPQLMQASWTDKEPERWPQVVSVIGQTGA
jgi:hypothetical protein